MNKALTYSMIAGRDRIKTAPEGRRCKYCNYPLSIYNHSLVCHVHKIKEIDEKIAREKKEQDDLDRRVARR